MANKTVQIDNHEVNEIKTDAESIIDGKIAALEKARREFPKALDKYIASLEKNGLDAGNAGVVLRHLEWVDPVIVVQMLKDAAKDGGIIGNVQDYVLSIQRLGPEYYGKVRKDCWKDGGKYGKLLNYAGILVRYGEAIYDEARLDCIKDKGALGNLSDYAWVLAVFGSEYKRVRQKLADGKEIGETEFFSHMRKNSDFGQFRHL